MGGGGGIYIFDNFVKIDIFVEIDISVKIYISVKIDVYVKIDISVNLSPIQLLTFLSIVFDISINI